MAATAKTVSMVVSATTCFAISPRLNGQVARDKHLQHDPIARAYFYGEDGEPKPAGTVLTNPAFARTLRDIADRGADAFYTGDIAADIVAAAMTEDELQAIAVRYRVEGRE